jgi:antitoxin VapB
MGLYIEHPEAERLARALAEATGESLTDAVLTALQERLQRHSGPEPEALRRDLRAIRRHFVQGRARHTSSPDEIIEYDGWGLPT